MSCDIGMAAIELRTPPRLAHTEYCSHEPLQKKVERETGKPFDEAWDIDFFWTTEHGPDDWRQLGRVTDMGHAVFLADGRDFRPPQVCPFQDVEKVWAFDAAKEFAPREPEKLPAYYDARYRQRVANKPGGVNMGGYYRTLVSGAIDAFGWDMLLLAASDQQQFARVIDGFFRLSLVHYKAWSQTSIKVFMSHDDMVWTAGPFMDPGFYRREIFPRYAELWKPLKQKGIRIIYTADGDYSMFLDDLAAAGVDGFVFEPVVPLDLVVQKFGRTHSIFGSKVDCRTLTFGTPDDVRRQIDATLAIAMDCPGFFFAVGNHIPANVPIKNAEFYINYLRQHWWR